MIMVVETVMVLLRVETVMVVMRVDTVMAVMSVDRVMIMLVETIMVVMRMQGVLTRMMLILKSPTQVRGISGVHSSLRPLHAARTRPAALPTLSSSHAGRKHIKKPLWICHNSCNYPSSLCHFFNLKNCQSNFFSSIFVFLHKMIGQTKRDIYVEFLNNNNILNL